MTQLRKFGQWSLLCSREDAELVLPLLEDYYSGKSCFCSEVTLCARANIYEHFHSLNNLFNTLFLLLCVVGVACIDDSIVSLIH